MKKPLIPFAVVALLLAAPVFAQETTATETTEAPATTETPAAEPESKTDQEFPVASDAEPQVGQGYLKKSIEKWDVRCIKAPEGEPEVCRLFNLVADENGQSLVQVEMQGLPKGGKAAAGVDVITPLGSLLTAQVVLKVDSGKAKRYPYTWCDDLGCIARFGLTGGEIAAMKKGANTVITIVSIGQSDKPIQLSMSLAGFTAAWNEIAPK